ncbi:MAG TPA: replication-relaxation family protein [Ktedonobacteraceae bacterium]|nr:replication-relaxation family protein [Ktedonobacteraceae bacterium]
MTQTFRMTPVYDVLLRGNTDTNVGLFQLHLATAEQLCRLHYRPGCLKTIKKRLKTLTDNGFIQADSVPTRQYKSPYFYTLGAKGIQYLESLGIDVPQSFRESKEVGQHYLFIQHALELNDILIAASLLHTVTPVYSLTRFVHERILKRRPYTATWQENGKTQTQRLTPDAFLDFRVMTPSGQRRIPVLLEHDRGTEGQDHFRRRLRAYLVLLKKGDYQHYLGVKAVTIAFSTFAGELRLKQMRDWTQAELAAIGAPPSVSGVFLFASFVKPLEPHRVWLEPCWHTVASEGPIALLES